MKETHSGVYYVRKTELMEFRRGTCEEPYELPDVHHVSNCANHDNPQVRVNCFVSDVTEDYICVIVLGTIILFLSNPSTKTEELEGKG
jgi:hypothetical protein